MNERDNRINYFEYFIHKIFERVGKGNHNDFTKLKLIKLLFFTTAIRSTKSSSKLLSNVFLDFVAMPYGHVESKIYDQLKGNDPLQFYSITPKGTQQKDSFEAETVESFFSELDEELLNEINVSVDNLLIANPQILNAEAFYLVELSHQWYSWKKNYRIATSEHRFSHPIDKDDIINEEKFFSLQMF